MEKQTISSHIQDCFSSMSRAQCNVSDLIKLKVSSEGSIHVTMCAYMGNHKCLTESNR